MNFTLPKVGDALVENRFYTIYYQAKKVDDSVVMYSLVYKPDNQGHIAGVDYHLCFGVMAEDYGDKTRPRSRSIMFFAEPVDAFSSFLEKIGRKAV